MLDGSVVPNGVQKTKKKKKEFSLCHTALIRLVMNLASSAPAELAAVAVLFGAVLLYFPSRPPLPPSVAAASQRLSYRSSICRLLR